jgi:hypothetical protein
MNALLLSSLAVVIAILAAHFWRVGDVAFAVASLAPIALLFVRRPWAARALQVAFVAGALEWLRTLAALIAQRHAAGLPYARLALILAAVALVTALAALALEHRALRVRFRRARG